MDRREAVKQISALLGVAISAPTMAGILGGCQARPAGGFESLTESQHAMLSVMTEHIIPTTDTPGAQAAGCVDFIEAMLTDFYSDEDRSRFLSGLEATDEHARETYDAAFMDCTSEQQFALLHALDEAAFPDFEAMDEAAREAYQRQRTAEGRPFIATLKELTVAGYYTSEVGATQELHLNPMGDHRGDIPYEEIGRAWA